MAIWGLAARAVMFAASGPPSGFSVAGGALNLVAPNQAFVQGAVGVLNLMDMLADLQKVYAAVRAIAGGGSDKAADEMVRLMRERNQDDTFRLEQGITWRREGDTIYVTASAVRDGIDYAWFPERGTQHMEAEPYFWDTAREVLARFGREAAADIDSLAGSANGEA